MRSTILLFGGPSTERLVSFAGAQNIAKFINGPLWFWDKKGDIYVVSLDEILKHKKPFEEEFKPAKNPEWPSLMEALDDKNTISQNPVFFLGLLGTMGEDGVVQSYLEKCGYSFTASGSEASSKAFNKAVTKGIAISKNIRVARSIETNSNDPKKFQNDIEDSLKTFDSIVIKPTLSGSSDGLAFVSNASEIKNVLSKLLHRSPEPYLIEEMILGREITVGVTETSNGLIPLPPSEVVLERDSHFDYDAKYLGKGSKEITPALITKEELISAQDIAIKIHRCLGCRGYSRTDLILDEKGYVFLEINTLPGLSTASFIPQQLAAAGITMQSFVDEQLKVACLK